jgi:hypothetical protein
MSKYGINEVRNNVEDEEANLLKRVMTEKTEAELDL